MNKDVETPINKEISNEPTPKRKGSVRRILKWSLISLVTLIVVAIALALCYTGPIAEWYVEKYDTELFGRNIEMDNLRIKLFKGEIAADNVVLYEVDNETPFARIDKLNATMALDEVFDNHIHITRLDLIRPYLNIEQEGDRFNFDNIIAYIEEHYADDESDEGEPWAISLDNISIEDGHFAYYDKEIEQRWELTTLNLSTPSLYLNNQTSTIETSATINNAAALAGTLALNYATWDFAFDGSLEEFPLTETYKYWTPYLNVGSVDGIVAADLSIEGNIMDIMAITIRGTASARNLNITTSSGSKVLSANTLSVGIEELNLDKELYLLTSLEAEGFATEMLYAKDGSTNFDTLFYNDPTVVIETTTTAEGEDIYDVKERVTVTTTETEAPLAGMTLHIGHLDLKGGSLLYSDATMHRTFEYQLRDIAIKADNLNLVGDNKMTISAHLPKQGSVLMRWEGSLTDFHNQSLMLMFNNVDMVGLSPFVEHYTGFPITEGNLTFRSQNVISDGALSGINQFGTYHLKVSKRDKSIDSEFNIPLRLAVYVLTDKDGHIDIDLPISGHLDEPKFSYGRIIMKAVGGLMLKLVASPFEFLADEKQDAFRHIDLDLMSPGLGSEQYARLDAMAEALKEDSSIKVRLTQRVNYKRAAQQLANLNLKIAYYNHTQGAEKGYLDMLAFSRINDMKLSNKEVLQYADSLLTVRGINPTHMTSQAKAMTLYGDMIDGQMQQLLEHRNRIISNYMGFQHSDIPSGAFSMGAVDMASIKEYTGKDRLTVTLIVDDEELELSNNADDAEESADDGTEDALYSLDEDNNSADEALTTSHTEKTI